MESLASLKELYEVTLKATYDIEIGGKEIKTGEVIAEFESIQIATIQEIKVRTAARGGYDNRSLVNWDETKELPIAFSQGIFSKTQLALLSNSNLIVAEGQEKSIEVPKKEEKETDENGCFSLLETPMIDSLFIYDKQTGNKITEYTLTGDTVSELSPYTDFLVRYNYEYNNGGTIIRVGQKLIEGYVRLEGKTRLKDDTTGQVITGLLKIPKLKLMSDLSMRLGTQANPVVAVFQAVGVPVGRKGSKSVFDLTLLNDDIDSDL